MNARKKRRGATTPATARTRMIAARRRPVQREESLSEWASPATFRAAGVAVLLVGAGLGFRGLADYLDRASHAPPLPPGALASIPLETGD